MTKLESATINEIKDMLSIGKAEVRGPIDGNALVIVGACTKAIRENLANEVDKTSIDAFADYFFETCLSDDYNHVLVTCMEYVDFVNI